MKNAALLILVLGLAGCSGVGTGLLGAPKPDATAEQKPETDAAVDAAEGAVDPAAENPQAGTTVAAPAPPPPATARTVEDFDTTTPAERTAAATPAPAPATAGDGRLGTTVASLGAAGEPGFWIKTPLVKERKPGRLFYATSGRSVHVQLIPSGGPSGGGSQVSLAAMRLLGAPLTGLPEIIVYEN